MNKRSFLTLIGLLFALGIMAHALRLWFGWQIEFAGWVVPKWVSVAAILIAGYLSWTAFRLRDD